MFKLFSRKAWWNRPFKSLFSDISVGEIIIFIVVFSLFPLGVFRNLDLPGLYMDAINPDYYVVFWPNSELGNPHWILPNLGLPLLGGLYHGMQNFYLGLISYNLLGTSVSSARIGQSFFGLAIVSVVFFTIIKLSHSRRISLTLISILSVDMAFLSSFRTSSYILLSGVPWLVLAIYFSYRAANPLNLKPVFLSGFFLGLAFYSYFVFLFFAPALIFNCLALTRKTKRITFLVWSGGLLAGSILYFLGYIQLIEALGGWDNFIKWLVTSLANLKPTVDNESYLRGVGFAIEKLRLALNGSGNEVLIFGSQVDENKSEWRALLIFVASVIGFWAGSLTWRNDRLRSITFLALPVFLISYIACAAWFGSRLAVHHFSLLVPIVYLLTALLVGCLIGSENNFIVKFSFFSLATAIFVINVQHQNVFHDKLVLTGGRGKASDAITDLARFAITDGAKSAWLFPEWGFFMPFVFLTHNKILYGLELSDSSIQHILRPEVETIRIALWSREDIATYEGFLKGLHTKNITVTEFKQRDGASAFFVLSGQRERFAREIISNPFFYEISSWQLSPGAIYNSNGSTVTVSAEAPATQKVNVSVNKKYKNIVSVRCDNETLARLQINWYTANDQFISVSGVQFKCSKKWSDHEMIVLPPEQASYGVVYVSGHLKDPVTFRRNSLLEKIEEE